MGNGIADPSGGKGNDIPCPKVGEPIVIDKADGGDGVNIPVAVVVDVEITIVVDINTKNI